MSLIALLVSNRKAYVWSVEDIATLREKYRICGALTGTLAQLSQQNVFLGPPLVLMEEEVVLLLEEGVANLVADPEGHLQPSPEQAAKWNKKLLQESSIESPTTTKVAGKQKSYALSEEAIAKRLARQKKREADSSLDEIQLHAPEQKPEPAPAPADSTETDVRLPMTRQSTVFPWYQIENHTYKTLSAAKEAGIWDYPSTPFQRARCAVFRYLWSQGNFLGTGIKFGGDFVVYPGDPLRYHSHFVATVHFKHGALRPMEIVAHGRLGTGTRKNHLICSVDEETYEVECFSVEWSGFG